MSFPARCNWRDWKTNIFADIFLPDAPDQVAFRVARQEWSPPDWTEKEKPRPLTATLVETQPKPLDFRLFVAPKDLDVLKSVNPPLDSLVDFGWFSIVAKPLFIALRYIYDHWIHNYGWAIVLLTVIINLAMFPLKLKSLRSAQEMQSVSPIIKGIQDKYKQYKFNDPRKQKMNEEVMKVYSEHHINPLGSCLPMLLQLPFLYGFYRVLDLAIELRHAPWTLWIKDLSRTGSDLTSCRVVILVTHVYLAADDTHGHCRPGPAAHDDDHAARLRLHVFPVSPAAWCFTGSPATLWESHSNFLSIAICVLRTPSSLLASLQWPRSDSPWTATTRPLNTRSKTICL